MAATFPTLTQKLRQYESQLRTRTDDPISVRIFRLELELGDKENPNEGHPPIGQTKIIACSSFYEVENFVRDRNLRAFSL